MAILLLVLLIVATMNVQAIKCPKYSCTGLEETQCARSHNTLEGTTFFLNPCNASNPYCNIQFNESPDYCQNTIIIPTRYPGENCTFSLQCFSGHCSNGTCIGKTFGTPCESDPECHVGFFCNLEKKVCQDTLSENSTCGKNAKCATPFVCNLGKCVKIGSIKKGEDATVPAACETFYIHEGSCAPGPKLIREEKVDNDTGPTECRKGLCYYTYDIQTPCQCGMNIEGKAYCNPGSGELDISSVIKYANKMANESPNECHITKGLLCLSKSLEEMGSEYYNAVVEYSHFSNWAKYHNNPECVQKMLNYEYWYSLENARKRETHINMLPFWGGFSGVVALITTGLFIVYFRKGITEHYDESSHVLT